jgi:hypothetical protein
MHTIRQPNLVRKSLECLPLCIAAALLLRATWLPVIEIKGFDTFALETVAMWATRAARVTLVISMVCLLVRPLAISRWWLALAVGIMLSPLADMAVRAVDLVKMMGNEGPGKIDELIVLRTGTWICAAGLLFWLLDLATTIVVHCRRCRNGTGACE